MNSTNPAPSQHHFITPCCHELSHWSITTSCLSASQSLHMLHSRSVCCAVGLCSLMFGPLRPLTRTSDIGRIPIVLTIQFFGPSCRRQWVGSPSRISSWASAFTSLFRARDNSKSVTVLSCLIGEGLAGRPPESTARNSVLTSNHNRQDSYVELKILTNDCYGTSHDIFEIDIIREITRQQAKTTEAGGCKLLSLEETFRLLGSTRHECIVTPVVSSSLGV
jgi:hypothetical protein